MNRSSVFRIGIDMDVFGSGKIVSCSEPFALPVLFLYDLRIPYDDKEKDENYRERCTVT